MISGVLMLPFFLGARHGLSLVLNIEQYEHIEGASRDAGVKVTLLSEGRSSTQYVFKPFFLHDEL